MNDFIYLMCPRIKKPFGPIVWITCRLTDRNLREKSGMIAFA